VQGPGEAPQCARRPRTPLRTAQLRARNAKVDEPGAQRGGIHDDIARVQIAVQEARIVHLPDPLTELDRDLEEVLRRRGLLRNPLVQRTTDRSLQNQQRRLNRLDERKSAHHALSAERSHDLKLTVHTALRRRDQALV